MSNKMRLMIFFSSLSVLTRLAHATPVDVNADGIVGPHEIIDLAENWKDPALVSGGLQPWQIDGATIFYNTGKVGIGSAMPHHQLRISGGPSWTSNGWTGSLELDNGAAIGWRSNPGGRRSGIGQSNGGLFFFNTESDPGTATSEAQYAMTITDDGRVGVGTTNPYMSLEVTQPSALYYNHPAIGGTLSSFYAYLHISSQNAHSLIWDNDSAMRFGSDSDPGVGYVEHMRITPTGNVGIGTDPNGGVKLDVAGGEVAIRSYAPTGTGVYGVGLIGVDAQGQGPLGIGIFAHGGLQAGKFIGDVVVNGVFTDLKSTFQIDHPLDPENKVLSHSSVDSPDMKNIYDGTVVTDAQGYATVVLPNYFEALNKDFRYQLTVIGDFAQAVVSKEIENNAFEIKTDKPDVKVSWMVTGIRQDAWAKAHPTVVEVEKSDTDRGKYLSPEVYGHPKEMGIHYRPEMDLSSETASKGE